MMFAGAAAEVAAPLDRRCLLLIAAGETLDASAAAVCGAAHAAGFDVMVVPWFGLMFQAGGAVALAGVAWAPDGAHRPLARAMKLAPDLIAALDPLEPPGQRAAVALARLCPDAVSGCITRDAPLAGPGACGVIAFAPFGACALDGGAAVEARLREIAEALVRLPESGWPPPLDDPARIVLAVQAGAVSASLGFRAEPGAPIAADLFSAWLDIAASRLPPSAPLLLPAPAGCVLPGPWFIRWRRCSHVRPRGTPWWRRGRAPMPISRISRRS